MLKTSLLAVGMLLLSSVVHSHTSEPSKVLLLSNINIINVKSGEVERNKDIVFNNHKIIDVRPHKKDSSSQYRTIDGSGKYVIPGLWDMHTHIRSYSGEENLPMFIANGITGIRDLGITNHKLIKLWKQQIADLSLTGPRIISSGVIIEGASPRFPSSLSVSRIEQVKPTIDKLVEQDAELTKLFQNIPPDVFTEIVRYSHERGLKTAGHIPSGWTQNQAAEIKLDSIEHMFGIGQTFKNYDEYEFSSKEINTLAKTLNENNVFQSPTIIGYGYGESVYEVANDFSKDRAIFNKNPKYDYTPAYFKAWWKRIKDNALKNFDKEAAQQQQKRFEFNRRVIAELSRKGVKMLAGTDTPNPYLVLGESLHEELAAYSDLGMSNLEVLRSATLYPGEYFGIPELIGNIQVGAYADLLILDANPLENIANTQEIHAVIANGQLYDRNHLQQLKANQLLRVAETSPSDFDQYIYMDVRRNGITSVREKYPELQQQIGKEQLENKAYQITPKHLLRLSKNLEMGLQYKQAIDALKWNLVLFPEDAPTQQALDKLTKK
ncbi:hypothetical protein EYS14_01825 [Alteromonadaceae bacterium M269]|nr:hypothetical protein EYS14_01825 [Alteromonadaceae bacterium M269]